MNKRQKKKFFKKTTGQNPPIHPQQLLYSSLSYHAIIAKPWGGLAALKKKIATRAVEDFNRNIQDRNTQIRTSRRYTR